MGDDTVDHSDELRAEQRAATWPTSINPSLTSTLNSLAPRGYLATHLNFDTHSDSCGVELTD